MRCVLVSRVFEERMDCDPSRDLQCPSDDPSMRTVDGLTGLPCREARSLFLDVSKREALIFVQSQRRLAVPQVP
jgi:hypothetical protein